MKKSFLLVIAIFVCAVRNVTAKVGVSGATTKVSGNAEEHACAKELRTCLREREEDRCRVVLSKQKQQAIKACDTAHVKCGKEAVITAEKTCDSSKKLERCKSKCPSSCAKAKATRKNCVKNCNKNYNKCNQCTACASKCRTECKKQCASTCDMECSDAWSKLKGGSTKETKNKFLSTCKTTCKQNCGSKCQNTCVTGCQNTCSQACADTQNKCVDVCNKPLNTCQNCKATCNRKYLVPCLLSKTEQDALRTAEKACNNTYVTCWRQAVGKQIAKDQRTCEGYAQQCYARHDREKKTL